MSVSVVRKEARMVSNIPEGLRYQILHVRTKCHSQVPRPNLILEYVGGKREEPPCEKEECLELQWFECPFPDFREFVGSMPEFLEEYVLQRI